MSDVYSTEKVNYHPELVEAFTKKESHKLMPTFVQLMMQNVCNQDCHFCSYRLSNWKNSEIFDKTKTIPWPKMKEILKDLVIMGVKAVELTGSGEPLAYPHKKDLLVALAKTNIEVSLVSNGTLLDATIADYLYDTKFVWARISIDSGCEKTYREIRRAPKGHWKKAWEAVDHLVARREDQVIGCGFVVTEENYSELYPFCELAKKHGVDNVRISLAFTPKGKNIITADQQKFVEEQIELAITDLEDDKFSIPNVFSDRVDNMHNSPVQDYDYCGMKDLLCVIEGESKVYTCCTLTGSPKGLIGSIADQTFLELWVKATDWRKKHDVKSRCDCFCLYEQRNKNILKLMDPPEHLNFI